MSTQLGRRDPFTLLVLIAVVIVGYVVSVECYAPARSDDYGYSSGNTSIDFYTGYTDLFGRETLKIIVISKAARGSTSDGRTVTIGAETLEGFGRIFLQDERGHITETKSPIFEDLWRHRKDFDEHAAQRLEQDNAEPRESKLRDGYQLDYLRLLEQDSWDQELKSFLSTEGK